jgi:hypothetical protein
MLRIARPVLVAALLAVVLSACSLFIPDQTLTNPLGLDGQQVTLDRVQSPGVAAQVATTTSFQGAFDVTFGDIDASGIPSGISPASLAAPMGVAATVTLASPTGVATDFPATVTVTHAGLSATVADGSGSPSFGADYQADGTLLVMDKQSCSGAVGTSCSYQVTGGSGVDTLLLIKIAQDMGTLWTIATTGDATNTLSGTFAVDVSSASALPADTQVTVTLSSPQGTLAF